MAPQPAPKLSVPQYALCPEVEGVQIFRSIDDPNRAPGFLVRCRCGYRAGSFATVEMAERMRSNHETVCLWPR